MDTMMGIMIQTAVLVTAILAVRKLFGEKLHAYIRYGLWLLVALRLLLPFNFVDSPVSVLRVVNAVAGRYVETSSDRGYFGRYLESDRDDRRDSITAQERLLGEQSEKVAEELRTSGENAVGENITVENGQAIGGEKVIVGNGQAIGEKSTTVENGQAAGGEKINVENGLAANGKNTVVRDGSAILEERNAATGEDWSIRESAAVILGWVWIAGSLLVGGTFFTAHLRFYKRICRTRQLCRGGKTRRGENGGELAVSCGSLEIYRVEGLEAPCLAGVLHPAIYIGMDIKIGTDRFRFVTTHERVHYLHGDHIWALLRTVLVTVYWFHPFVWIAASASVRDGEIACDHGTIRRLGDEERLSYGEMLLDLSRKKRGGRIYSYGTMLRPGNADLKERIIRLAGGNGSRLSTGILAVMLMLVMAGCAFTGASRQGENMNDTGAAKTTGAAGTTDGSVLQETEESESASDPGSGAGESGGNVSASGNTPSDEKDFDPGEEITEVRQLIAKEAEVSGETMFGADGPALDYAGQPGLDGTNDKVAIFHDYFGLIVYDLTNSKILRSLDLAAYGCQFTQGDNACQVAVSADGRNVWLHPRKMRYMFRYEVDKDLLWQQPLVKSFEVDLEAQDLFNRYLVTESERHDKWESNYLYEEYKDERGLQTAYIYLTTLEDTRLGNLQCVWDDMVYILWDEDSAASGQTTGAFPYRYDGVVNEVQILYARPCESARISDTFGERVHPVNGETRVHEGVDYAAEKGTDIRAAADGIVYETGYSAEHGNYVVLLHINGDMTYYCHCQDITVSQEEQVARGTKIATVGSSGRSTGAHLHFALSQNGVFVDPLENMDHSTDG